jgi:hypothetical protein
MHSLDTLTAQTYNHTMRLRLSDGQRKHLANTARIIGGGGIVIYGVPEIRLKAVEVAHKSNQIAIHHIGFLLLGLLIFGTSELLAALVLRGVNS